MIKKVFPGKIWVWVWALSWGLAITALDSTLFVCLSELSGGIAQLPRRLVDETYSQVLECAVSWQSAGLCSNTVLVDCWLYLLCNSSAHMVQQVSNVLPVISTQKMVFEIQTHTHTRLTALCPGLSAWAGTGKVKPIRILQKQETVSGSGISWAICNFAFRSRQITTPVPTHSDFYRLDALPAAQPTSSKHWRQKQ